MIIEDEELRTLFKAESDEHLRSLEAGLLRLEVTPGDSSILDELFREAHSLKGAAGMLGVSDVEKVAHRFEDALGAARNTQSQLSSDAIGRLCRVLDSIGALVAEVVTGKPSGVILDRLLAEIEDQDSPGDGQETPVAIPASLQIDTIRVEPQKLDALMMQAAELMVDRTRITHRAAQADRLLELWEEWTRSNTKERRDEFASKLYELRDEIHQDGMRLDFSAGRIEESVRAIRLLPLSTVFNMFPRMVRDIAKGQQKEVRLVIQGERISADKRLLEELKDPLMHMIRNAVDHGIESPSERGRAGKAAVGTIRLTASQKGSSIVIEITDDGRGLGAVRIGASAVKRGIVSAADLERMTEHDTQSLIFMPGFSTSATITDISGRGVGMDVVRTSLERLKGTVSFESSPGVGSSFRVTLPATLATSRVLLVDVSSHLCALPFEHIHSTCFIASEDIFTLKGRESVRIDGRAVSLVALADLLQLKQPYGLRAGQARSCVVIAAGQDLLAVVADELLDEQEVVVRPFGSILNRVRNVSGGAILATGAVCTVLNPLDLVESARSGIHTNARVPTAAAPEKAREVILLVEDSITTRTWEKRGLEAAGYEVITAVDGLDALQKLAQHSFNAVVSDVQMPNMDGLTLTDRIRKDKKLEELPVILVTSLADDSDKRRGVEAGASAYIPKQAFNQGLLVETLRRLI
jgi:two-component system, chemotaxis family, sensor kinase CheA